MTLAEIRTLFEYDAWATDRTLESVSSLSEPRYLENLKSSHGGIHGTLVHLYSANWLWLQRWKGTSPAAHISVDEIPSRDLLKARWKGLRGELDHHLAGLTDARLVAPFPYKDLKGNAQSEPLVHQMQHVINHATYHRGQVVTMVRQLGGKPNGTDMIAFFRTRPTTPLRDTLEGKNY